MVDTPYILPRKDRKKDSFDVISITKEKDSKLNSKKVEREGKNEVSFEVLQVGSNLSQQLQKLMRMEHCRL